MKKRTAREQKLWDDGFNAGVSSALYVLWSGTGDSVTYDEIVGSCCGLDELVRQAKRDGNYTKQSGLREAVKRAKSRASYAEWRRQRQVVAPEHSDGTSSAAQKNV